jgi:DNA-binding NarL/FixJ family response regulator
MENEKMTEASILFVDDEHVILKALTKELREEHFTVTAVAGGSAAISALKKIKVKNAHYDLVITDLMMPGIDGFEVLKAAKELAPLTMVIILTGYGDIQSAINALRLGADDFTLKPCEVEELVFRIRHCLEKQSLMKKIIRAQAELEQRVQERTAELYESNVALKVILKKREEDRALLAEQVLANATRLVEPFLDRLQESRLTDRQRVLVDILRANISELTSPFANNFSTKLVRLTPAEIQVANLVKLGKRTKEIAEIMHLSPGTIGIHRKNIRKKLDLTNQKSNLQTVLSINS